MQTIQIVELTCIVVIAFMFIYVGLKSLDDKKLSKEDK